MNDLTRRITGKYKPQQAIIIYNWNGSYYLESHEISNGELLEGIPLTKECIGDMVGFFADKQKGEAAIRGAVPCNLLMCDWNEKKNLLVWHTPTQERVMHFTDDLKIKSGKAWQPALLHVVADKSYNVFALKTNDRPTDKDLIYAPPYHNCNERTGSVCLGSAKMKKPKELTYASVIEYYENLFWNSEFSHLAGDSTPIKGNLNLYWNKAIKTGHSFDNEILKPLKATTYEKLIKGFYK